jgi:hypothetical protein
MPTSSGLFRREWDYYSHSHSQGDETMLDAESLHALTSIVFELSDGNDA